MHNAHDAYQLVEMSVSTIERQIEAFRSGCDPHVVVRDAFALFFEVLLDLSIGCCGSFIGVQEYDILAELLPLRDGARVVARAPDAVEDLTEGRERQIEFAGSFELVAIS